VFVGGGRRAKLKKRKVYRRGELLASILEAAVRIKKFEGSLRQTTHDLRTRVAKCTVADGGIFENLFLNCNKFIISV
jgi:hypothetical protein